MMQSKNNDNNIYYGNNTTRPFQSTLRVAFVRDMTSPGSSLLAVSNTAPLEVLGLVLQVLG